jgi:hypothetical protein
LGDVFATLNPHGWAFHACSYVQINADDDGGDFWDRHLKCWGYQYTNRACTWIEATTSPAARFKIARYNPYLTSCYVI